MKKEVGAPVMIGLAVVVLIAVVVFGWRVLNPPAEFRPRPEGGQPAAANGGRKAGMPTAPQAGNFSQ